MARTRNRCRRGERLANKSAMVEGNILDEAKKWPSGTNSGAAIRFRILIVAP